MTQYTATYENLCCYPYRVPVFVKLVEVYKTNLKNTWGTEVKGNEHSTRYRYRTVNILTVIYVSYVTQGRHLTVSVSMPEVRHKSFVRTWYLEEDPVALHQWTVEPRNNTLKISYNYLVYT